jgi:hypothetical protein
VNLVKDIRNYRINTHFEEAIRWLDEIPEYSMVKARCVVEAIFDAYMYKSGFEE